jgi:hypothetical protein
MRKFAFAALLAAPIFAGLTQSADAQNRYCCGDEVFAGEMVVTIETVISNRPRPGYETGVHLREGAIVLISHCDEFDWCHLEYPLANAFVPRSCLRPADFNGYRSERRGYHEHLRGGRREYYGGRDRQYHDGGYGRRHNFK